MGISLINNLQELLSAEHCKEHTLAIANEAMNEAVVLEALLHYAYGNDKLLMWQAAWALDMVSKQSPLLLVNEKVRMRALAMRTDIAEGVRRLIFSILFNLPDDSFDVDFYNFVLEKMLDVKSPPGVQALAMKLASRMSNFDEDLHKEFVCIVQNLELEYYSAGVRSVIKRCLKSNSRKVYE